MHQETGTGIFTEPYAIAKQNKKQKNLKQTENVHQRQKREVKCIIFLPYCEIELHTVNRTTRHG